MLTANELPVRRVSPVVWLEGLLDSGQINKNDDNDARLVAVAAQRAHDLPELSVEDHSMVLRVCAPLPRSGQAAHPGGVPTARAAA